MYSSKADGIRFSPSRAISRRNIPRPSAGRWRQCDRRAIRASPLAWMRRGLERRERFSRGAALLRRSINAPVVLNRRQQSMGDLVSSRASQAARRRLLPRAASAMGSPGCASMATMRWRSMPRRCNGRRSARGPGKRPDADRAFHLPRRGPFDVGRSRPVPLAPTKGRRGRWAIRSRRLKAHHLIGAGRMGRGAPRRAGQASSPSDGKSARPEGSREERHSRATACTSRSTRCSTDVFEEMPWHLARAASADAGRRVKRADQMAMERGGMMNFLTPRRGERSLEIAKASC